MCLTNECIDKLKFIMDGHKHTLDGIKRNAIVSGKRESQWVERMKQFKERTFATVFLCHSVPIENDIRCIHIAEVSHC